MTPALHPHVGPLGFLLGTWRGEGEGFYPTVPRFAYGEEVRFWHSGKPFLAYSQRTWSLADGRPLHAASPPARRRGGAAPRGRDSLRVLMAPVLPGLSDSSEQLARVVDACRDAGGSGLGPAPERAHARALQ
ncbi:MAG: FABP family protein [Acidimicrobiia bacterium]